MSLFQKTVFKEFVAQQNQAKIKEAFEKYQAHFSNPEIKANIHTAKEEQYQEGFLNDLFVHVLGYTLYPQADYNLITEKKTATSAKKSDAAILQNGKVLAVIELKSTRVFDLRNIEGQAFAYKNAHPDCRYVITSNFAKMRFYLDNTLFYEEFELFEMTETRFAQLYTLLQAENMLADLPLELKARSVQKQEEVTLAFYNDYQAFKEILFANIYTKNKKKFDELLLFGRTQRLIDRIIFLCFASDRAFLPLNLVDTIIKEWERRLDEGEQTTLYDRFRAHFRFINKGFKSRKYDIYGFNGGLFAEDEVLDTIQISDNVLRVHVEKIARYNFDTDVDVNVLGHIFEYSLHQLDQKRKEIIENAKKLDQGNGNGENGQAVRKVEGIFYTPIYVINYIIEETLGQFCRDKKAELSLDFTEIDFTDEAQKEEVAEKLKTYEAWLEELSVLDPACGSGAFLNQVLSFFMQEYSWLESLKTGVLPPKPEPEEERPAIYDIFNPAPLPKPKPKEQDIVHKIMENNVFGVDINFESVAITQLSLWLRMAQGKRKLNNMEGHIKEGNSLIDDLDFAPNAFLWEKEFPAPLQKGGFRLIVGNPPYVSANNMKFAERQYFNTSDNYKFLSGKWDLFLAFIERAMSLLQPEGTLSFIVPYGLLNQPFAAKLRKHILDEYSLQSIADLHEVKVFADATVPTCIPVMHKAKNRYPEVTINHYRREGEEPKIKHIFYKSHSIEVAKYQHTENHMFRTEKLDDSFDLLQKIKQVGTTLGELFYVSTGAEIHGKESRDEKGRLTSGHSKFDVLHDTQKPNLKPYIEGAAIPKSRELGRYCFPEIDYYLDYKNNVERMRSPKFKELFESPKIIVRRSSGLPGILATFDERKIYTTEKCLLMIDKKNLPKTHAKYDKKRTYSLKLILGILNSRLMHFYYKSVYSGFIDVYPNYLKALPVPEKIPTKTAKKIVEKVDILLAAHQGLGKLERNFIKVLQAEFGLKKVSNKLKYWYRLDWESFTTEMKKAKSPISNKKKFEWVEIFEEKQREAQNHLSEAQETEKELDKMVCGLYGLDASEEEVIAHFGQKETA